MEAVGGVRAATRAAAVAVSLGYLFLWIVTPTNVYKTVWLPKIRLQTNSTFFGTQGVTILLYTFPVLFIAVMGSFYVHLGKKCASTDTMSDEGKKGRNRLAIWRRPMIMRGLGIVSRIEIAFFLMFIALLVWSFSTYLHIGFAKITPQSAAKKDEEMWESKLDSAALRLGLIGNICLAFLFFPVTRGSSVLPLFGLTSEASVKYHIWLGHIVMTLFTAHGVCYILYWAVTGQASEMLKWAKTDISNVAGEISLLCGIAMWVTTIPRIRRKMFELFFYVHHLYIGFIVFFVFHVGFSYSCIMLPGFYLFVVDRFLRFLQSRRGVRLLSARVLPCETLELNFSKSQDLSYTPTSIMFLNVPSISKMQWHPFTVSSSSLLEPEKISVTIKGEGSWSKKLYQMVSSSQLDRLDVAIEGPYGPASVDFLSHDLLVMVSGGSGITPFISIIRELVFLSEAKKCKTPKVLLVSSFKNTSDLTMLDLILPNSGSPAEFPNLDIKIEAYITREKEPTSPKQLQTVWFKPSPTDVTLTAVLGPNTWLWLGVIIASSFVMFLLFLGLLTRYYIYPIDHNTNHVYSYTARGVLSMLLICFCIAATSTVAFYWNKKQGTMEGKQIQNMEGSTPTSSPNSWFYNADREMESLPQQALEQNTSLHYGERPDLKRILFERKETSIGVLVCGPKKMRHEVANICAAGLAENLHFEFISFSW